MKYSDSSGFAMEMSDSGMFTCTDPKMYLALGINLWDNPAEAWKKIVNIYEQYRLYKPKYVYSVSPTQYTDNILVVSKDHCGIVIQNRVVAKFLHSDLSTDLQGSNRSFTDWLDMASAIDTLRVVAIDLFSQEDNAVKTVLKKTVEVL